MSAETIQIAGLDECPGSIKSPAREVAAAFQNSFVRRTSEWLKFAIVGNKNGREFILSVRGLRVFYPRTLKKVSKSVPYICNWRVIIDPPDAPANGIDIRILVRPTVQTRMDGTPICPLGSVQAQRWTTDAVYTPESTMLSFLKDNEVAPITDFMTAYRNLDPSTSLTALCTIKRTSPELFLVVFGCTELTHEMLLALQEVHPLLMDAQTIFGDAALVSQEIGESITVQSPDSYHRVIVFSFARPEI